MPPRAVPKPQKPPGQLGKRRGGREGARTCPPVPPHLPWGCCRPAAAHGPRRGASRWEQTAKQHSSRRHSTSDLQTGGRHIARGARGTAGGHQRSRGAPGLVRGCGRGRASERSNARSSGGAGEGSVWGDPCTHGAPSEQRNPITATSEAASGTDRTAMRGRVSRGKLHAIAPTASRFAAGGAECGSPAPPCHRLLELPVQIDR